MIALDIETSGLDPVRCGIWQIGAIELENPRNFFFEEARIDDEDFVEPGALEVTGMKEEILRDGNKQSQKELIRRFLLWVKTVKVTNCICQNPQFDLTFIFVKARKFGIIDFVDYSLPHRAFDLHSIASLKYYLIHQKLLIENYRSKMNLSNVLLLCGIVDFRKKHNALEDSKLAGECFNRIVYGKKLLSEFDQFEIPEHLKQ